MDSARDTGFEPTPRVRVRVRGAVQGVGFRPYVYHLATERRLTGWVRNDGDGVVAEVQGAGVEGFLDALRRDPPPLARIDRFEATPVSPRRDRDFRIIATGGGPVATGVAPDAAVCGDCLAELFDPSSRFYRYPFLTCTNCGPRYTITHRLPYDRPQTSMAEFGLCRECWAEYADPLNRRFHAQPIACPACGPRLDMKVEDILDRIQSGEIVALKGLGGFHLVCNARNAGAVSRLRRRKRRGDKPFAVMVANVASARTLADVSPQAASLMAAPSRPIVLVEARTGALAPAIAPGLDTLGVMLPSTPIHYLLFHEAAGRPDGVAWLDEPRDLALIMTSANPGGEPLLTDDAEARSRLDGIADHVVGHDRPIVVRCDDSVLRCIGGAPAFVRRARGFVPQPIRLARPVPCILGVGGHQKVTICVTRGDEAFLSQHIGDMHTGETRRFFSETVEHLLDILEVAPEFVAHDLHPDFHTTRFAESLGVEAVAVQHHHAHVAAVMAEHDVTGPVLGLALDGFGLGPDGEAWGGELLRVSGSEAVRVGHLAPLAQPGGDVAARQPWRMGAAALHVLGRGTEIASYFHDQPTADMLARMLARGVAPATTSCGRLFDAACGLLGVCPEASYDSQAPMTLEALVREPKTLPGGWRLNDGIVDLLPTLERLIGCEPANGAELFHGTLIEGLAAWVAETAAAENLGTVVLAGGCFLNRVLTEGLVAALERQGLNALLPQEAPTNDGGLSLGQVWVAALAVTEERNTCVSRFQ